MIARNNSQGPHASRPRGDFGEVNFRRVGNAGAVSGRPDNAAPSRPANAVNEISRVDGRSIALGLETSTSRFFESIPPTGARPGR
jgi:hypothetical protein